MSGCEQEMPLAIRIPLYWHADPSCRRQPTPRTRRRRGHTSQRRRRRQPDRRALRSAGHKGGRPGSCRSRQCRRSLERSRVELRREQEQGAGEEGRRVPGAASRPARPPSCPRPWVTAPASGRFPSLGHSSSSGLPVSRSVPMSEVRFLATSPLRHLCHLRRWRIGTRKLLKTALLTKP